jgi:hypothetical protein
MPRVTSQPKRVEYLIDFIDEVIIECPACGAPATVIGGIGSRARTPTARCRTCGFNRGAWPAPDGILLGAVAKRRCPRCGRWLEKRYQRVLAKRRQVVLSCPCKAQTSVKLHFASVRLGGPYDPYFGYPLWFQKAIGRNVLWAYNRRHLALLKAFVAASVRPRTPGANGSVVSRLPSWITKGTRRPYVLRALRALEKKDRAA